MNRQAFTVGNAIDDQHRGWFIGQFVPADFGLRRREDLEVKWGIHHRGEQRRMKWSFNRTATTTSILIDGVFVLKLRGADGYEEIKLSKRGDYAIINAGIEHSWYAETDSIVLTIRAPSIEGDQVHCR